MANAKCLKSVIENLLKLRLSRGGFDKNFEKIRVIAAQEGLCSAALTVGPEHSNIGGHLHGGMAASLVDSVSTMALLTYDQTKPGVSVELSVTFLNSAPIGTEVVVSAETLKRGRNLAFLSVSIADANTGKLLVKGKHTKYIA